MQFRNSIVLASLVTLALAAPAIGQQVSTAPGPADQSGYLSGLAGAVTGGPSTGVLSVEYAENMRPDAVAYVNLSYFNNLLRPELRDDLNTLSAQMTAITGLPFDFSGRD